jgi:ribosomal RNA-processing protein 7
MNHPFIPSMIIVFFPSSSFFVFLPIQHCLPFTHQTVFTTIYTHAMSSSLSSATTTTAPLIKGYLPVRLRIPPTPTLKRIDPGEDKEDQYYFEETYFYIREHRGSTAGNDGTDNSNKKHKSTSSNNNNNNNNNATLFVANAPIIPNVSTRLLLQSIFGRFANVKRVTVVPNPRGTSNEESSLSISSISSTEWTPISHLLHPSFLPPLASQQEGKFAHVVFASSKDMKQCKKALEHIMSSGKQLQQHNNKKNNKTNNNNNNKDNKFFLQLDELEIQTLTDQSLRQAQAQRQQLLHIQNDDDDDSDSDHLLEDETKEDAATGAASSTKKRKTPPQTGGVLAVAQRYRDSLRLISRERILQECNAVMAEYEQAEEAKRHAIAAAKTKPDDDGFVTVTYNTAVGSKMDLEQTVTGHNDHNHRRKSGQKRSRSRKQKQQQQQQQGLPDFYRFQRKEQRQRTMDELRQQFQQDLDRVQRLKEEKQYKPF